MGGTTHLVSNGGIEANSSGGDSGSLFLTFGGIYGNNLLDNSFIGQSVL